MQIQFYSYVSGILNYELHAPINYWLYSNVENLSNYTTRLPTIWKELFHIRDNDEWQLFHSLGTERIGKGSTLYSNCRIFILGEKKISESY